MSDESDPDDTVCCSDATAETQPSSKKVKRYKQSINDTGTWLEDPELKAWIART